jgi:hypothetical protein
LSGSEGDGSCDCEIPIIASHFCELSTSELDHLSPSVLESILSDPGLVIQDEDSIFDFIHRLASDDLSYFGLLEFVRFEFLSDDCMSRALEFISSSFDSLTFGIWSSLRTRLALPVNLPSQPGRVHLPSLDSMIISESPQIFSVFGGKTLQLLYRGSRDGFEASAFHGRCNGHFNTVSLIHSTNECIFGGYTPVAWTSRGGWVSDPSLKSFLFTIKNPHNLPAQIFKLKQAAGAIYDHYASGPRFGGGTDLAVADQCRSSNTCWSNFGYTYENSTKIKGNQVFTGAYNFRVQEIEVFEVI